MNLFDHSIIGFINQFSHQSKIFDTIVAEIAENLLVKGTPICLAIWWLWFKPDNEQAKTRTLLITTLIAAMAAEFIAKFLTTVLPFRTRPILDHSIDFVAPYSSHGTWYDALSSFPSDHATLFFSLAIGVYFVSRKLGLFAIIYTLIVICMPRIYLGLHYPTDVLAGAIIGLVFTYYVVKPWFVGKVSSKFYNFSETYPQLFYPAMFLLTFQICSLFSESRQLARMIIDLTKLH